MVSERVNRNSSRQALFAAGRNQLITVQRPGKRRLLRAVVGASLALTVQSGWAFQFNTGSDWMVRWDNTVKYNLMVRVQDQDKDILSDPAFGRVADDADLSFDQWSVVSNRLDLVSEFDAVWRDQLGVRVSAAGWYDHAYSGKSDHPGLNKYFPGGPANTWGALSVKPGRFTDTTEDYHYFGGEVLDAFAFAQFELGDISGNFRGGRHTVFWGNSLAVGGATHGIAGSMTSLDLGKALSVPGIDAQELFMPSSRLSTVLQLTNNLTLNAYWSLEYEENRLAQLGSYFSASEIGNEDSEFLVAVPGSEAGSPRLGLVKAGDETPDANDEWGINLQYYLDAWALDASFTYLNYNDKLLHGIAGYQGLPDPIAPDAIGLGEFKWVYKDDIDLFGISLNKEIAGFSVGLDFVRRENAPLPSDLLASASLTEEEFRAADSSHYVGPVGDTNHVILNGTYLLAPSKLYQGGSLLFEVTASWLDKVTENEEKLNANISEDRVATSAQLVFAPQWFQVLRSTDLTMPMSVAYTIDGNAPIAQGGDKGLGNASIGLDFLYNQMWNFTFRYNVFFGSYDNGGAGLLKDRDNVSFTVKRTF